MITNATSFWKFIENHHIEIPIIQRDYAQGRKKQEYLRKNFLANIKQSLDNRLAGGTAVLKLDFVYGSENNGTLLPLDGQQRLTTLWLLHWYVALKAGKLDRVSKRLKKFTYETRISSREFCQNLCASENFMDAKDCTDIVGYITSRTWFYSSWKQDPTIQSMLRMIGGTKINDKNGNDIVDGLEELFEGDMEHFEEYWEALTSENAPIVFYHLPLENFGLTDDLYIKMNARGKQLTPFENFKADFIEHIQKQAKESDEWKALLDPTQGIPIKLDTAWTDIFWKHPANNNEELDKRYFAFLNRYFLNCAIIYKDATEKCEIWKLYGKESDDSSLSYDNGFHIYSLILFGSDGLTILHNIGKLFEKFVDAGTVSEYLPVWFKKFDFIPSCTDKSISTLTQAQRVVFFGICRYFESCTSFNEIHFRRWMRVVCNLVENTTINTVEAMIARIKLVNELSAHVEDIYEYLSSEGTEIRSKASQEQLAEEMEKAKQILKPQEAKLPEKPNDWNEEEAWNWEAAIIEAEGYAFFNGAIRFLFRNKNGEWDWNSFSKKWENAQVLFGDNGLYKNKSALLRYFISKFTQSDLLWGITFDSAPSSWRSSLLNKKWNDPVDEMLRSSSFEVEPDFNSTFEGKQKTVQEELVTSSLLDYIERGCHLNQRNNDIYILYPYNAKADWKKYIIADKRNKILSSLYGGRIDIDLSNKQPGKIYTNQKIGGCDFFWGWDIHFIYVLDDAKYMFRWQNWNWIDMYDGDKKLYEDNKALTINSNDIKDETDLIEKMDQCIARYLNAKRNANQPL